jgi:deoxyribodipyrimidine photo-lyase
MLECLADLDERLGRTLVIRWGWPDLELPALAREVKAEQMHYSADSGPFARRRITRVERALREAGVDCFAHPGLHAVDELDAIRTQQGKPYTVFSPFHRTWLDSPRRELLGRPRAFGELPSGVRKGRLPSLASLGLEDRVEDPLLGGETRARERLSRFLSEDVRAYEDNHDSVALPALRLPLGARDRGAASGRRGRRRLPAAALLARLLPPRPAPPPAQRSFGVPGPLPRRDLLERVGEAIRGLVRGPHRLPAG